MVDRNAVIIIACIFERQDKQDVHFEKVED